MTETARPDQQTTTDLDHGELVTRKIPPFQPHRGGPELEEMVERIGATATRRRQLVRCVECRGWMIDYGQEAHTACTSQPGERRTAADLDPSTVDLTASDAWRRGTAAALATLEATAAERPA